MIIIISEFVGTILKTLDKYSKSNSEKGIKLQKIMSVGHNCLHCDILNFFNTFVDLKEYLNVVYLLFVIAVNAYL